MTAVGGGLRRFTMKKLILLLCLLLAPGLALGAEALGVTPVGGVSIWSQSSTSGLKLFNLRDSTGTEKAYITNAGAGYFASTLATGGALSPASLAVTGNATIGGTLVMTGKLTLGANGLAGVLGETLTNPAGTWVFTGVGGALGDRILTLGLDHATAVSLDSDSDIFYFAGVDGLTLSTAGVSATLTPDAEILTIAGATSNLTISGVGANPTIAPSSGTMDLTGILSATSLIATGASGVDLQAGPLTGANDDTWANSNDGDWVATSVGGVLGDRTFIVRVDSASGTVLDSDDDIFVLNGADPLTVDASGAVVSLTPTSGDLTLGASVDVTGAGGLDLQGGALTLQDDNTIDSAGGLTSMSGSGVNALDLTVDLIGAAPGDPVVLGSVGSTLVTVAPILGLGTGGEYLDCVTADGTCALHGAAGALGDRTLSFVVDSAGNAGITTDTATLDLPTIAPVALTGTGIVSATNITDVTDSITISLWDWRTSAAPPLEIVAGTTPNSSVEGNAYSIEWGTGEEANKITLDFTVPQKYVSGLQLCGLWANDAAAANNAETLSVTWYGFTDGGADNPAANDECAAGCAMTNAQTTDWECVALDEDAIAAAAAGMHIRVDYGLFAVDQTMHLLGAELRYTATQ